MTETQVVVFEVYGHMYAVPIHQVKEIILYEEAVKLPNMPEYLEGIISLRGQVLPVVDLAGRCGFPSHDAKNRKALIVDVNGKMAGLVVDEVTEVANLDPAVQENADWGGDLVSSPYLRGIGRQNGNLLVLLELEQVLDFSVLDKLPMPAAV